MERLLVLALSLPVLFLTGCNSSSTYPVTGKLTVGGQPAPENTRVNFQPLEEDGQIASGTVNAEGTYTLYTGSEGLEGAAPGKYKVYITPDASGVNYMESDGGPPPNATGPFPREWTQPSTSPKEVEVTAGENKIDIEI